MSDTAARRYDPIAVSAESTVVAEYVADPVQEAAYQSEAALEAELVRLLQSQAYEYLPVTSEEQLVANLRAQLEVLNGIVFTDAEWSRFFDTCVAGRTTASWKRRSACRKTMCRCCGGTTVRRRT